MLESASSYGGWFGAATLMMSSLLDFQTHSCFSCPSSVQFDKTESEVSEQVSWVPMKLSSKVRCVLSLIEQSPCHKHLLQLEPPPQEKPVPKLNDNDKKVGVPCFSFALCHLLVTAWAYIPLFVVVRHKVCMSHSSITVWPRITTFYVDIQTDLLYSHTG